MSENTLSSAPPHRTHRRPDTRTPQGRHRRVYRQLLGMVRIRPLRLLRLHFRGALLRGQRPGSGDDDDLPGLRNQLRRTPTRRSALRLHRRPLRPQDHPLDHHLDDLERDRTDGGRPLLRQHRHRRTAAHSPAPLPARPLRRRRMDGRRSLCRRIRTTESASILRQLANDHHHAGHVHRRRIIADPHRRSQCRRSPILGLADPIPAGIPPWA